MIFFSAIESILSIFLLVGLGYYLTEKGWFSQETAKLLPRLVNYVALPPYMLWNIMSTFDQEKLLHLSKGLAIPFLSMLIAYGIGCIVAKVIGVEPGHQGTFHSMFFVSSAVFVGLPVNLALFGEASVPYVLIYFIANASSFWTLGVYSISRDGTGEGYKVFSMQTVKNIFSPPLLGFFLAIVLILLGLRLPRFIMDTCRYLGNLTTPLSMLFIGLVMNGVKLREIRLNKDLIAILFGRFIVSPLIVLFLSQYFPIPELMKKVFVIQAAMPVMTNTTIIAKVYNADAGYSAVATTVTTLAAMVAIPIYMMILQ